jgi:hypothetical protein
LRTLHVRLIYLISMGIRTSVVRRSRRASSSICSTACCNRAQPLTSTSTTSNSSSGIRFRIRAPRKSTINSPSYIHWNLSLRPATALVVMWSIIRTKVLLVTSCRSGSAYTSSVTPISTSGRLPFIQRPKYKATWSSTKRRSSSSRPSRQ